MKLLSLLNYRHVRMKMAMFKYFLVDNGLVVSLNIKIPPDLVASTNTFHRIARRDCSEKLFSFIFLNGAIWKNICHIRLMITVFKG